MTVLKAGVLAYIDTFQGLVPCRVLRVYIDAYYGATMTEVKVTGNRPGYAKGEVTTEFAIALVRRDGVRRRGRKQYARDFDGFEITTTKENIHAGAV